MPDMEEAHDAQSAADDDRLMPGSAPRRFSQRLLGFGAGLASLAAAVLVGVLPVLRQPGWPENHEGLSWKFRTGVYAAHQERGDWLPVWSSEDLESHGTPFPVYYHKLFYIIDAAARRAFGRVKPALIFSIALWLAVGATGCVAAARALGSGWPASWLAGAMLPLANYTVFDWLVRGAFAELSAIMLVPWVLAWCLSTLRTGAPGWWLAPLLVLLLLAHSVIAYASLLVLLSMAAVFVSCRGWRAVGRALPSVALQALAVAGALLPFVLVGRRLNLAYDVTLTTAFGYDPGRQFQNLEKYFVDYRFMPGDKEMWFSVQINRSFVMTGLATAILLTPWGRIASAWRRATRAAPSATRAPALRPREDPSADPLHDGPGIVFLLAALAAALILQMRFSLIVYRLLPGLAYLQFPWRMLGVATPVVAVLLPRGLEEVGRRHAIPVMGAVAATLVAGLLLETPCLAPVRWKWYTTAELERTLQPGREQGLVGMGDYWPRPTQPDRTQSAVDAMGLISETLAAKRRERDEGVVIVGADAATRLPSDGAAYRAAPRPRDRFESSEVAWDVALAGPAELILPISHSGLERVVVERAGAEPVVAAVGSDATADAPLRRWIDPPTGRIRLRLAAGEHVVRVVFPTQSALLGW